MGKKLADAKISNLERAEQDRTSRRHKRSWKRTMSWSSPVRSKSARDESARDEPEDTIAQKAEAERKRREVFTSRRVQFHRGADLHSVKDSFSVAEARQREGWAPKTPAPSAEQKDGQVWYNWRTRRSSRGISRPDPGTNPWQSGNQGSGPGTSPWPPDRPWILHSRKSPACPTYTASPGSRRQCS